MTTENNAAAEQLSLLENPTSGNQNGNKDTGSQNAGSPTKSVKSTKSVENGEAMDSLIIEEPDSESQCKRACYWIIGIFLFSVFAAAVVILAFLILRVGGQPPVVWTTCGKVQGVFNFQKNHFSFVGVPYALPPVDHRRWQPPVIMSNVTGNCWTNDTDIWDASQLATQCVQRDQYSGGTTGSEDCLYLNIYTPRVGQKANLPVVVWIHGGDFDTGNASFPGFSPNGDLAKQYGVVFVSIQYRLNAFGFLVLKELSNNTGNLGLQDQIAALKWIQENIANFGGNPNNVTIFGQGSGGSSVLALMVSPHAGGLFHKAWSASPSVVLDTTLASARDYNSFFVNDTGCVSKENVKECLLGLSASDVLHSVFTTWSDPSSNALPKADEEINGRLVIDGNILPSGFIDAFKNGSGIVDVPLLIGTTAQEVDNDPEPIEIGKEDNATYVRIVETHLGTFKKDNLESEALTFYPFNPDPNRNEAGAEKALTSMVSDIRVSCPVDNVAESAISSLKSPVYRYVITGAPSKPMHSTRSIYDAKYAFHEIDIMAYFDTMSWFFVSGGSSNADDKFATTFRDNVHSFIKTGKPLSPEWLVFNSSTALIDQTVTIVDRYHKEECEMWERYDLLKYGWKA